MAPDDPDSPESIGDLFRDVFDLIDQVVDGIPDDEVDEQIRRVFAEAGYDPPPGSAHE